MTKPYSIGERQAFANGYAEGLKAGILKAASPDAAVREAFLALSFWCTDERHKIGAVDGYDYRSGEEFGIRRVEIEIERRAALSPAVAEIEGRSLCDTTETKRFTNPECRCPTYAGNLGPCQSFQNGENGRCAFCDHELTCHQSLQAMHLLNAASDFIAATGAMPDPRAWETLKIYMPALSQAQGPGETKSAPQMQASHNHGETLPNGDAAVCGADTACGWSKSK